MLASEKTHAGGRTVNWPVAVSIMVYVGLDAHVSMLLWYSQAKQLIPCGLVDDLINYISVLDQPTQGGRFAMQIKELSPYFKTIPVLITGHRCFEAWQL